MFSVNRKTLMDELSLLQTAAEVKSTMPVLAYVRFVLSENILTLTATSIDVSVVTRIQAEGQAWDGCLPSASLYSLAKLLTDDTLVFTQKDNRVQVKAGRARHLLPLLPAGDFPLVEGLGGDGFSLSLPLLTRMIDATAFSVLPFVDHLKPSDIKFTGVSMRSSGGKLEVAASQKVVTGIAEVATNVPDFTILIPQQAAASLKRLSGEVVVIKHTESAAEFTAGPRTVIVRQLMGEFPQWRGFVPEFPWAATLSGDELRAAIRRATVTMGIDNAVGYEPMKATFDKESVLIETRGGDRGKSDEIVSSQSNLNGDTISIGFVNGQVLSVLGQCGERVTCHLAARDKPMMFKPAIEGIDLTFIVMPVGVKW